MKQETYTVYQIKSSGKSETLIALLLAEDIVGLEELEGGLVIYASNDDEAESIETILSENEIAFEKDIIDNKNWNEEWETNFQPINVEGANGEIFAHVRAGFHAPFENATHEIVITPKMSFGTGHHETTHLMMAAMQNIDFQNKTVIDFGTGTGILAILADKLGAKRALGIDIDEWSIENAIENGANNQADKCSWLLADKIPSTTEKADIILANINLNVLLENMALIKEFLVPVGKLLLSGILTTDEDVMKAALLENGFCQLNTFVKNKWACIAAETTVH